MDEIKELDVIRELLETKQYTRLRQRIADMNIADTAAVMEELEEEELLKIFRILPKSMAADVFSYLEVDSQQFIIVSLSEREAANIIDNLMADDATDLLEEMPANIVKKLLASARADTTAKTRAWVASGVSPPRDQPDMQANRAARDPATNQMETMLSVNTSATPKRTMAPSHSQIKRFIKCLLSNRRLISFTV